MTAHGCERLAGDAHAVYQERTARRIPVVLFKSSDGYRRIVKIAPVLLRSDSTFIRPLELGDSEELLELRRRNDDFLREFEPIKSADFLTLRAQQKEIQGAADGWTNDRGYSFGVFCTDGAMIGKVGLSNVARGAWQSATLGYFIDKEHNGLGHGCTAVALACEFAFTAAKLHRVQAAVMPRNYASTRLLVKNGFRFEGLAVRYLRINGCWEDHHVYSQTLESWPRSNSA